MLLDYYNIEKMYEFEQKEKDRAAREFWKWMSRLQPEYEPVKKEANDK